MAYGLGSDGGADWYPDVKKDIGIEQSLEYRFNGKNKFQYAEKRVYFYGSEWREMARQIARNGYGIECLAFLIGGSIDYGRRILKIAGSFRKENFQKHDRFHRF